MTPYSAATSLEATPLLDRARKFGELGGNIWRPDHDPWVYEELLWMVELLGIRATATSKSKAISNWIANAKGASTLRATDGRPDCPYNGQAAAPNLIPVEA